MLCLKCLPRLLCRLWRNLSGGNERGSKKVLTLAVALAVAAAVIHIFEEFSTFSLTILASPHILSFHAIAQWLADDAVQSRVRR